METKFQVPVGKLVSLASLYCLPQLIWKNPFCLQQKAEKHFLKNINCLKFVESMFTCQIFATAPRTKGPNPDVYNWFRKGENKSLNHCLICFCYISLLLSNRLCELTTKVKDCYTQMNVKNCLRPHSWYALAFQFQQRHLYLYVTCNASLWAPGHSWQCASLQFPPGVRIFHLWKCFVSGSYLQLSKSCFRPQADLSITVARSPNKIRNKLLVIFFFPLEKLVNNQI